MSNADWQTQFDAINQPEYFNLLKQKVNAIRTALISLDASAEEIRTRVNGVLVVVSFISETEGRLRVGYVQQAEPGAAGELYDWRFPIRWLEEPVV